MRLFLTVLFFSAFCFSSCKKEEKEDDKCPEDYPEYKCRITDAQGPDSLLLGDTATFTLHVKTVQCWSEFSRLYIYHYSTFTRNYFLFTKVPDCDCQANVLQDSVYGFDNKVRFVGTAVGDYTLKFYSPSYLNMESFITKQIHVHY